MAEAQVIADPFTEAANRLKTLNKVMTSRATIAQSPKEPIWTAEDAQ